MKAFLRVVPLLAVIGASAAHAGVNIKVDDDTFFTIGAQIQPAVTLTFDGNCGTAAGQCTSAGNPTGNQAPSGNFGYNAYIRRTRLLTGGQIGKQVTFALNVDMPRLGQNGAYNQAFVIYEAFVNYQFADLQFFDVGFMLAPWSRNWLISSGGMMTLENRATVQTLFNGDSGQRETGIGYRGYFLDKKLNIRASIMKGVAPVIGTSLTATTAAAQPTNANDRPAFIGRIGYSILGNEGTGMSIPGIQFSETPIVAIGVAGYYQNKVGRNLTGAANTRGAFVDATGAVLDGHVEYPFSKDTEVVVDGAIYRTYFGDGQAATAWAAHGEAGFRVNEWMPTVAYEYKDTDDVSTAVTNADGSVTGIANKSGYRAFRLGMSYWVNKHKFNVKGDFSFVRNGKIGQNNPDGNNSPYLQKVATLQTQILF
jgi:hypothetical protein